MKDLSLPYIFLVPVYGNCDELPEKEKKKVAHSRSQSTRISLTSKMTSLIKVFRQRNSMQIFMIEYVSPVKKFLNGV